MISAILNEQAAQILRLARKTPDPRPRRYGKEASPIENALKPRELCPQVRGPVARSHGRNCLISSDCRLRRSGVHPFGRSKDELVKSIS